MHVIDDVYRESQDRRWASNEAKRSNCVKRIYEPFTDEEISSKIAQIVTAPDIHARESR